LNGCNYCNYMLGLPDFDSLCCAAVRYVYCQCHILAFVWLVVSVFMMNQVTVEFHFCFRLSQSYNFLWFNGKHIVISCTQGGISEEPIEIAANFPTLVKN
jgi:hypothetical protein